MAGQAAELRAASSDHAQSDLRVIALLLRLGLTAGAAPLGAESSQPGGRVSAAHPTVHLSCVDCDERHELLGDDRRRRGAVKGYGTHTENLCLESGASSADLLSLWLGSSGLVVLVVCEESGLLGCFIDAQKEDPGEQVSKLADVERNAADERWSVML